MSNALKCSDKLLIPVQAEALAYESVPNILQKMMLIHQTEDLEKIIAGILVTMWDARTTMSKDVERLLRESYNGLVFKTVIPKLQEAPKSRENRSCLVSDENSRVGSAYAALWQNFWQENHKPCFLRRKP